QLRRPRPGRGRGGRSRCGRVRRLPPAGAAGGRLRGGGRGARRSGRGVLRGGGWRSSGGSPARPVRGSGPVPYYLKTPKTGGDSFLKDIWFLALHPLGKEILGLEGCYSWHRKFNPDSGSLQGVGKEWWGKNCMRDGVVAVARDPREHIMSQYWHCKSSIQAKKPWNKDFSSMLPTFDEWIRNWTRIRAKGSHYGDFGQGFGFQHVNHFDTRTPYKCYHPISMQSHRFTCCRPFQFQKTVNLSHALRNMWAAWFVGVLELYQESVCLFMARTLDLRTPLPAGCNSSDTKAWRKFQFKLHHNAHGVDHSHRGVREEPPELLPGENWTLWSPTTWSSTAQPRPASSPSSTRWNACAESRS
ncbi:unnamed protein product, partial [Prorocentrum cordatum]